MSNFNPIARLYRPAEYLLLGPLLQRTRTQLLPHVLHARHALLLGDGDGRFLAQLLHRAPHLHALALDTSSTMLTLLRRRCRFAAPRLQTLQADATQLPPTLDLTFTDLITTHFFLDCLTQPQLDHLALHLARQTQPGALWLLSDFALPRRQPWRALGALYIRALYLAFRLLTGLQPQSLPDIPSALTSAGFIQIHHHSRLDGLLYSELWQKPVNPPSITKPTKQTT